MRSRPMLQESPSFREGRFNEQLRPSGCWVDVTWFTNFGAGGWRCRRIEELPNGAGVRFVNHFEYTGIFASALERATIDFLQKGMQQENANLKTYMEKQ